MQNAPATTSAEATTTAAEATTAKSKAITSKLVPVKGTPGLKRHPNGTYYGRFKAKGSKNTQTRNLGTTILDHAKRALRKLRDESEQVDHAANSWTLETLLEKFVEGRDKIEASTLLGEAGRIKLFREHFCGGLGRGMVTKVRDVKPVDISIWLKRVGVRDVDGESVEKRATTRNQYRAFVRFLFEFAVENGVIAKTPFNEKTHGKAAKDHVDRYCPDPEEAEAILAEIRNPTRDPNREYAKHGGFRGAPNDASADFAEFLYRAMLCPAEVTPLTWDKVDWGNPEDLVKNPGEIKAIRLKTVRHKGNGKFQFPIYPWLRPLLERKFKAAQEAGKAGPKDLIFTDEKGNPIQSVRKAVEGACRRLKIANSEKYEPQRCLRQAGITRLMDAGVLAHDIAPWQGHKDNGAMIQTIYSNTIRNSAARRAAEVIAAAHAVMTGKILPFKQAAAA